MTAKVLLPMTKLPEACKSTDVPAIMTPGPPAVIVVPSIEIAVGLGVKTSLPTVNTVGKARLVGITAKVLLPMTKLPEACKSTDVPAIMTPGPPAVIVVPSIEIAVGLGVKTSLPTVNTVGKACSAETNIVLLPTSRRPEEPKLTCVPLPCPPDAILSPFMKMAFDLAVKPCPPTVNIPLDTADSGIVVLPIVGAPMTNCDEISSSSGLPATSIPLWPEINVLAGSEIDSELAAIICPPTVVD